MDFHILYTFSASKNEYSKNCFDKRREAVEPS